MTKYLAGVLSVIAVGVLLIAYGLLSPRVSAFASPTVDPYARPVMAGEESLRSGFNYPTAPRVVPVNDVRPVQAVTTAPATRVSTVRSEPRRDWKKTALLIGGSTAGGAGLGGIFGGKKGALIGAAIGGGASTIYEATK